MNISLSAPACSLPRPLRLIAPGTAFFLALLLSAPAGTAHAQDGTLDTSFGAGGIVTTDLGSTDTGNATELQTDGKILVAGKSGSDFGLVRYNANGTLDNTFGTSGVGVTDFTGQYDFANSATVLPSGEIIAAGYLGGDFGVMRYTSSGTLDTSFGASGFATTDVAGGNDDPRHVLVQSDGKILVSGVAVNGANVDFGMARFNADGTLDASFGSSGTVATDFGNSSDSGSEMVLLSDGRIVLAGESNGNFALVRYTSSTPTGPCDTADWSVVLAAGDYPATTAGENHRDDGNTAGMAACATDGLDSDLDAPEPGAPNGSYVQLYLDGPASDPIFSQRYTKQHVATEDLTSAYYDFTLGVGASGYSGQTLALEASDLSGFPAGYDLVILDAAVDGAGTNPLAHDLRSGPYSFTYGGARALTLRVGALPAPTVTLGDGGDLSGGDGEVPSTEPLDIPWSATGTKKLKIQYSTDGGSKNWHDILPETEDLNVINGGTTSWTPPEDTYGKSVLIRVTTTNAVGGETSQTSSAFMVPYPAPVISITGLESSGDASFDDISAFVGEAAAVRVQAEYAAGRGHDVRTHRRGGRRASGAHRRGQLQF